MKQVEVYTDGACSGNPGPGGWGAVLRYRFNGKVYEKELSGGDASTTNNRMELTAFIEALRQLKEPCEVRLCSDSQYVINGLEKGWARGWKRRGWKKSDGSPALNPDLWEQALEQEAATSSPTSGSKATQATRRMNAATSLRSPRARHMAGDRDDERCFSARERV